MAIHAQCCCKGEGVWGGCVGFPPCGGSSAAEKRNIPAGGPEEIGFLSVRRCDALLSGLGSGAP
jgi:hypothetical protein